MRESLLRFILLLVFVVTVSGADAQDFMGSELPSAPQVADTTEVVVIGTIHGDHAVNQRYSAELLRDIIVAVDPAAILIELPATIGGRPTVENGRRVPRLSQANEGWAENAAAAVLGVPLIPYDRDGRNEYYASTRYFARQDSTTAAIGALEERVRRDDPTAVFLVLADMYHDLARSQTGLDRLVPPDVLNSDAFDALIRAKRRVDQELVLRLTDAYPDQAALVNEMRFVADEWIERNGIMADNIRRIARRYGGRRIVVLTGYEHRYILRGLLNGVEGLVLHEYWELMPDSTGG